MIELVFNPNALEGWKYGIELLERDVDFRVADAGDGMIKGFDDYAYGVDDLDKASEFFAKTMGMALVINMPTGGGTPTRSFYNIGYDVLGLRVAGPGTDHSPHFALRVENVDETLAVLAGRGVEHAVPSAASKSGLGRNTHLTDPKGVQIVLLDRPELSSL